MANTNLHKSLPAIFAGVVLILVAQVVLASETFTVINTNDDGPGSLRQAIEIANASVGPDIIAFNIPGAGPHTIAPIRPLPEITEPVTIDGYSQPGTAPATNGAPAVLLIELDGINVIKLGYDSGLHISAGNSTVRGLVINRFGNAGIHLEGNGGNVVEGNFIGTDVTGTEARGNLKRGVYIDGTPDNRIGGSTAKARNVISDNNRAAVEILLEYSIGNTVQGNYIGTDATGTVKLGSSACGVFIRSDASNNTIGPDNIIRGHDTGISLESARGHQIYNNNFIDNVIQAHDTIHTPANASTRNVFNLDRPVGGNYWSDWRTPDADCDGFVDDPYVFTYGADYLPWDRQDGWLGTRPKGHGPSPKDGDILTKTWVLLSWSPVCQATSSNVYFSENFDDVAAGTESAFLGNQTATSLIVGFPGFPYPDGLVQGTTYYWRIDGIDELNPDSPWKGDIWSFKLAESLSGPLDTTLTFTTGGDALWFGQTTTSYYGGSAAQSGDISHSDVSWMETIVSGRGTLTFYWKVSSEEEFDFLEFYIDGWLEDRISHFVDWEKKTYTIDLPGLHILEWRYIKDGSFDVGSDCGWVDKVEWMPAP